MSNISSALNEQYSLAYNSEQIGARVAELGSSISQWAKEVELNSGQQVLGLCVLRGAVFFFVDLLRAIEADVEPTFCRTSAYDQSSNTLSESGVRVPALDVSLAGRNVLVIDDICDSGSTLEKLESTLRSQGASEVKSAVLVRRVLNTTTYQPTWVGFSHAGPEWFVGYGMDDNNRYRNVSQLYLKKPN